MPFVIRKLPNQNLYIVKNKITGHVYGKTTKPKAFISVIEINKHKKK
jgi:hypothetical protein